jgi:hypothetical protein
MLLAAAAEIRNEMRRRETIALGRYLGGAGEPLSGETRQKLALYWHSRRRISLAAPAPRSAQSTRSPRCCGAQDVSVKTAPRIWRRLLWLYQ